jgi:hypothetical protein
MQHFTLTNSQYKLVREALLQNQSERALILLEGFVDSNRDEAPAPPVEPRRRQANAPESWFRIAENGQRKLSDEGEEQLYAMYDSGATIHAVAKRFGIAYSAAKHRYQNWQKLVAAGKRPNAKPSAS